MWGGAGQSEAGLQLINVLDKAALGACSQPWVAPPSPS